jgi:hypothetical protein
VNDAAMTVCEPRGRENRGWGQEGNCHWHLEGIPFSEVVHAAAQSSRGVPLRSTNPAMPNTKIMPMAMAK